jgi:hypothetical protein
VELSEILGTVAVASMAVFYALEERSDWFILLFALACLSSCGYALVIRSWPFAFVELLWAVIALRRWIRTVQPGPSHA